MNRNARKLMLETYSRTTSDAEIRDVAEEIRKSFKAEASAAAETALALEALNEARDLLASDPDEADRILRRHFAPAAAVDPYDAAPLETAQGLAPPEPIITRATGKRPPDGKRKDPVVSVGEPGLLTGAGNTGKSYLTFAIARAAAVAHAKGEKTRLTCGLEVTAGPVLVVSYEYGRIRGFLRMKRIDNAANPNDGEGAAFKHVHLVDAPGPLYVADHRQGGVIEGDAWAPTWEYVEKIGAKLLVVDSGGLGLEGAGVGEDRPVKVFLRALAKQSEATGCGVLVVTHSNKAARKDGADSHDADIAAGSAAWYDQARGVLMFAGDATAGEDGRKLLARKCNEGVSGWGAYLKVARGAGGEFGGFELFKAIEPGNAKANQQSTNQSGTGGGGTQAQTEDNPYGRRRG